MHEIERVCASKNRFQLYEAFTKALLYPTKHGNIIDTTDNRNADEDA